MHGRSRGAVTTVAVAVSLAFTACGSDDKAGSTAASTADNGGTKYTIGWVPPTVAPFESAMRKGMELQAEALGDEFVVAGGQFDPKVQITAVDSLVDRDVDAIVIWPLDEQGIQPAFDRAREKNIPIIVVDAPNARADVNFQNDDLDATVALAKFAAEEAGEPCKVAIIEGVPVVSILKARNEGYAQGAEASGCEIVDKQTNTNDTPEKAGEIVQTWKTRFGGDLSAILAINDPSALAAAAQTDGDFDPIITGLNGDAPNIDAIKEGRVDATQAQPSPEMGNGMVYAAHQLLLGKEVAATIAADYVLYTKDNIDTYKPYDERLKTAMTVSLDGGKLDAQVGG